MDVAHSVSRSSLASVPPTVPSQISKRRARVVDSANTAFIVDAIPSSLQSFTVAVELDWKGFVSDETTKVTKAVSAPPNANTPLSPLPSSAHRGSDP